MRILTAFGILAAMTLLSGTTAFADHDRGRDRAEVRDNDGVRDNDDNRGAIVVRDDDAMLRVLNQRVAARGCVRALAADARRPPARGDLTAARPAPAARGSQPAACTADTPANPSSNATRRARRRCC